MKNRILNAKPLMFLFVSVLLICSMSGISYGDGHIPVCKVGDVIEPGQSCTIVGGVPDFDIGTLDRQPTNFEPDRFFVAPSDAAIIYYQIHDKGSTFFVFGDQVPYGDFDFDGRHARYGDFAARKQTDGGWLIEAVPGPSIRTEPRQMYWIQIIVKDGASTGISGIFRANLDGSNIQQVLQTDVTRYMYSAMNDVDGKIYWGGEYGQQSSGPDAHYFVSRYRVNLDGSNPELIKKSDPYFTNLKTGAPQPSEDFDLDVVGRKMYWVEWDEEARKALIHRSNLDGSRTEVIHLDQGIYPEYRFIKVDGASGKMYFSGGDFSGSGIYRSNLDGSNTELIFSIRTVSNTHDTFAVDGTGRKLYFIDGSSKKILRSNLDGSNIETLMEMSLPRGYLYSLAVDTVGRKIYWVKSTPRPNPSEILYRANLDGSNVEEILTEGAYKSGITFSNAPPLILAGSGDESVQPDLAVESFQPSNPTLVPGESFTFSGIVRNRGKGQALPTKVRYYRAINKIFTEGSKKLGETDVPSLAADATSDASIVLTAPTTLGIYYYRACVNIVTGERTIDNNCTPPIKFTVKPESDLAFKSFVTNIKTKDSTVAPGESFRLAVIVTNRQGKASPTTLRYYRSTDETLNADDTEIATYTVPALADGSTSRDRISVVVPTTPGVYYYGACIDPGGEERITDNNCTPAVKVTVKAKYELAIESFQVSSNRLALGESFKISVSVRNRGEEKALPTTVRYYRSTDETVTDDDTEVRKTDMSSLAPDATSDASLTLTAPKTPGIYYYGACIGSANTCTPTVKITVVKEAVVLIPKAQRPPLYWIDSQAGTLHRLIGGKVEALLPSVQNATSLVVDAAGGKLYWAEKTSDRTGKIRRADLDGSNVRLVKDLTSVPHGIALEAAADKLYLTNAWGKVQRMNLDGLNFQPNLITGLKSPKNITVEVAGGKLYWTERTGNTTGKIRRADLDGSNVRLVKDLTSLPQGIALDTTNREIYLTNVGGKIQRLNFDGSNFQSALITDLESPEGIAVDAVNRKLYWTEKGSIRRANLNGKNIQNIVTGLAGPANIALGMMPPAAGIAAAPASVRGIPEATVLHANYPNPFNPETWIPYQLAKPADVSISIYAADGQLVQTLALGLQPAGIHENRGRAAYWDGRNALGEPVASGLYFYTLSAGDFTATRKMLIVK